MNTVIRSPNWIGDGIMCLPAIRAFRKHFPHERLTVLAKRYLADIFLNIPEIDEIMPIPDRWTAGSYISSVRQLKARRYDRGILFTNSFSSALLFRLAGIRSNTGYDRDGRGWLLSDKITCAANPEHHQYYYLNLIEHLAGEMNSRAFPADLAVTGAEKDDADQRLAGLGIRTGQPLLAVSPGAAYGSAKAWLPERFRLVIAGWQQAHPDCAILLLGGPAEKEGIAAWMGRSNRPVFNLVGSLTLRQSIAILSRCQLFIGNDSGLMHIAAALAVPLVAIFGPTEPGKTSPLGRRFRLLHQGADCAPCSYRDCPADHRCMAAVGTDQVLAAAEELWEERAPVKK
jgi:heptosyltransferase-2